MQAAAGGGGASAGTGAAGAAHRGRQEGRYRRARGGSAGGRDGGAGIAWVGRGGGGGGGGQAGPAAALLLPHPARLPLGRGDDAGDGTALGPRGGTAAAGSSRPRGVAGMGAVPRGSVPRYGQDAAGVAAGSAPPSPGVAAGPSPSPPVHGDLPLLAVLPGLGQLLEVLLGVGAYLHHSPGLDEGGDLLPALAVLLKALKEEAMLLGRPSARVLSALGGRGRRGDSGGGHADVARGRSWTGRGSGGGGGGGGRWRP